MERTLPPRAASFLITFGAYSPSGSRVSGGWASALRVITPKASFDISVDEEGNTFIIPAEEFDGLSATQVGESAFVLETNDIRNG